MCSIYKEEIVFFKYYKSFVFIFTLNTLRVAGIGENLYYRSILGMLVTYASMRFA